ncbi:helix-turn-helix domain-containing protein [Bradyrhizobium elkanii]
MLAGSHTSEAQKMPPAELWTRLPISRIEDLSDAVRGAGLEATQMSSGHLSGSLVFSSSDDISCSSGLIDGRVSLFGPLSQDKITIGAILKLESGARHWLNEVQPGTVGVFFPKDDHDALYAQGSMYAALTLSAEKLEREAAEENLVLDRTALGETGLHARPLSPNLINRLRSSFERIHDGTVAADNPIADQLLSALIAHLARPPHQRIVGRRLDQHGKIVERARAFIREHLCEPMSIDQVAASAYASRRTLFRAFEEILDETPRSYVRKLRLHRIRHDLASDGERACTIALVANQWGISDLGRMSGSYRELFGERPSETVSSTSALHRKLARTT